MNIRIVAGYISIALSLICCAVQLMRVARFLGKVVGKAHARQMDEKQRATWLAELTNKRSKTLDAPPGFGAASSP